MTSTSAPTADAARCWISIRTPTLVSPSGSCPSRAAHAADSIMATSRGVASTSRLPEPRCAAVSVGVTVNRCFDVMISFSTIALNDGFREGKEKSSVTQHPAARKAEVWNVSFPHAVRLPIHVKKRMVCVCRGCPATFFLAQVTF